MAVSSEDSLGLGCSSSSCCCCYCCVENVSTSLVKRFHLSSSIKRNNNETNEIKPKADTPTAMATTRTRPCSNCDAHSARHDEDWTLLHSPLLLLAALFAYYYYYEAIYSYRAWDIVSVLELTPLLLNSPVFRYASLSRHPKFKESERCV